MEEPFPGAKNTLPWLDEQSNMRKEKNFFETRVAEYQTGAIKACDFIDDSWVQYDPRYYYPARKTPYKSTLCFGRVRC